ncbi:BTAD domain-containing putative transcriptional regulator [Prescottella soli]|uniref:BTAD domain-containing putative transcriptional regulator n=1 Tax=Prescottella soli TaxID=1543852 RepID=UPI0038BBDDDC
MARGIEFTVLGPVAATRGGRQIVLDQQQRALLAALLVAFPHSVDIERLRAQVRYTRAAAAGNGQVGGGPDPLAQALEGLRGRLDDGGTEGSVLVRDGTRYQLAVPRDAVDAARFVDEVRRGDAVLPHAPDTAADAYREGLRQWRGLAYEGLPVPAFADTVFIESEVARLTERRFEARISLARAELEAGSPASAAVEAEAVVADHPLDERAWDWNTDQFAPFAAKAREFLDAGVPVAAICGATGGLAMAGLLDDREHTSNAAEFLNSVGYGGGHLYRDEPAVTDRDLVTAAANAPVHFAREILERLDVFEPNVLASWFKLYGRRDPAGFYELMAG